jgi:Zn-finger nucleic acid-binding protein
MVSEGMQTCERCAELQQQIAQRDAEVAALRSQLAAATKNSATSSKPPSSDIVKKPKDKPKDGGKRKRGGQMGHEPYQRAAFTPEQIDDTHSYTLDHCPDCGGTLADANTAPRVLQQVEIIEVPLRIDEHRGLAYWCCNCRRVHYASIPSAVVQAGLAGPRLTALVAFLKGVCHASFSTIRRFLRDVVGVTVSRGQLAKVVAKVSAALQRPYEELLERLPDEAWLNVDETGHKNRKDRFWTWCFRADLYTLFKIAPTRSADVLLEVLGTEFDGVLGCDFFSAYRRYMRECGVHLQFCLAHFIREVKYLTTLPEAGDRAYGERLRLALRALFGVIHQREQCSAKEFGRRLEAARADVLWHGTNNVPATPAAQRLAKRLAKHGVSYFRFVTTPGVEPTNNLAEQAIRFVVIDRLITQGTRSDTGQRWCERIWTTMATCAQQGRSVYEFLSAAVEQWFHDEPGPSLLESRPTE